MKTVFQKLISTFLFLITVVSAIPLAHAENSSTATSTSTVTENFLSFAWDAGVDSHQNEIVVGSRFDPATNASDFTLSLYNSDLNKLDSAVKNLGGSQDKAYGVALDDSDNFYVAGSSNKNETADFALVHYVEHNHHLEFDTSFGKQGIALLDFEASAQDIARDVLLDPKGNIILTGFSQTAHASADFALAIFDKSGALITKVKHDFGGNDVCLAAANGVKGFVYLAGSSDKNGSKDFAIARYKLGSPDLDVSFGDDGVVLTDIGVNSLDEIQAITTDPDGNLYVAGFTNKNGTDDFVVAKYDAKGELDPSFGVDGLVVTDFNANNDKAHGIALTNAGEIIVSGSTDNTATLQDFAIAKYKADGTLDSEFGDNGLASFDFDGADDVANALVLNHKEDFLIFGSAQVGKNKGFGIANYPHQPREKALPKPYCGDAHVNQDSEECDDGNRSNSDGCSNKCERQKILPKAYCGDNHINQDSEECDGTAVFVGENKICLENCELACAEGYISTIKGDCIPEPSCGDNIINQESEACDGTATTLLPHQSCQACQLVCDEGYKSGLLGCTPIASCGDGVVNQTSEECDDGNTVSDDACSNNCIAATCGDGVVNNGEQCDGSVPAYALNAVCSNCALACEPGYHQAPSGCILDEPVVSAPVCGNAILESGEGCDDGNTADGDDCSSDCQEVVHPVGEPEVCGDGVLDTGEECDDGNTDDDDTCSATCTTPIVVAGVCGDLTIDTDSGETCDDGNFENGDGCDANCLVEVVVTDEPECGNFIVETSETCDDGNLEDDDGCSAVCIVEPAKVIASIDPDIGLTDGEVVADTFPTKSDSDTPAADVPASADTVPFALNAAWAGGGCSMVQNANASASAGILWLMPLFILAALRIRARKN